MNTPSRAGQTVHVLSHSTLCGMVRDLQSLLTTDLRLSAFGYVERFVNALTHAAGAAANMMARMLMALRMTNPDANIVVSGHSLGAVMLLSSLRSMTMRSVINTLILIQTALPIPAWAQQAYIHGLIHVFGLANLQHSPVGNLIWAWDTDDTILARLFESLDENNSLRAIAALFGIQKIHPLGQYIALGVSTVFASALMKQRNQNCPGWGIASVRSIETNTDRSSGHAEYDPSQDTAVAAVFALVAALGSGECS